MTILQKHCTCCIDNSFHNILHTGGYQHGKAGAEGIDSVSHLVDQEINTGWATE